MSEKISTVEGKFSNDVPVPKKESLWSIFFMGIWSHNPGLCQLLGLCPLLAVTTSACSALGLALATIIVLCLSSLIISFIRKLIFKEVRIPIYVMLIATFVTVIKFYTQAYFEDLYSQLGIYLSLIVTNCIIMGRAEAFAGRNGPLKSLADALGCGIGFGIVLFILGAIREILGSGTLFMGASQLFGPGAKFLECNLIEQDYTVLVAILPPGGFFVLAFVIAFKNFQANFKRNKIENSYKIKSIQN
ncbi:MAG: electron transport complex subunit E [Succinivibrio sp.]